MSILTTVPDGQAINPDSLRQTLNYNVDGTINYVSVAVGANEYRQSFTYTLGKVTSISPWTKQ